MRSTSGLKRNVAGFSLVEVMVALVLCVLVLPIALSLLSMNLDRINYSKGKLHNSIASACILETAAAEYQIALETAIPMQRQYGQTFLIISQRKLSNEIPYLEQVVKASDSSSTSVVGKYCLPPKINLNYQAITNSVSSILQNKAYSPEKLKECGYHFEELYK